MAVLAVGAGCGGCICASVVILGNNRQFPTALEELRTIPHDEQLSWLRTVLGGDGAGPPIPYLCRPSLEDPQLLLPLRPRAAASASLRRHHDARSWRQRVESRVGRAGARLGGLQFGGGELVELAPFPVIQEVARRLGEPEVVAAITLGPRRRNRKPVLQLLRPDGELLGFAKVGWSPLTRRLVGNEADMLRRLDGRRPATIVSPVALAGYDDGDVLVSVATALDPTRLRGVGWAARPLPSSWVLDLARSLGSRTETVGDVVERIVAEADGDATIGVEAEREVRAAGDRIVAGSGHLVVPTGLWHGDLTPWNTVTGRDRAQVWDWEFAAEGRPLGLDLLHATFETIRRRGPGHEEAGIAAARGAAAGLLAPAGIDAAASQAVAEIHLLELLVREHRLASGGDRPDSLGDLGAPLRHHLLDEPA